MAALYTAAQTPAAYTAEMKYIPCIATQLTTIQLSAIQNMMLKPKPQCHMP
jgi:hypothetical protein